MLVETIPLGNLALLLLPVSAVIIVMHRWQLGSGKSLYALARMLVQLLLIGYVLTTIFEADSPLIVAAVLLVMVSASAWIALNTLSIPRMPLYGFSLLAILAGGGITLALVTQAVLHIEPWYDPRIMIPLAGMVFANAMNSLSLSAERLEVELERGADYESARAAAMRTAMIPVINSLFAVGLVSLPGMMTGQILSGVDPLIAARYQIMVMGMIFASAGLSTALFLALIKERVHISMPPK